MQFKLLSSKEITSIYHNYMEKDFPPSELKPLQRIQETMDTGLCHFVTLYDDCNMVGYAVFIIPDSDHYCLLDYFAILSSCRGGGFGHEFLSQLPSFLKEHFPNVQGVFIECESIKSARNASEEFIRTRRIAFYENCGCQMTSLQSSLFGVEYSILLLSEHPAASVQLSHLDHIYQAMFKQHHYQTQVRLWE